MISMIPRVISDNVTRIQDRSQQGHKILIVVSIITLRSQWLKSWLIEIYISIYI